MFVLSCFGGCPLLWFHSTLLRRAVFLFFPVLIWNCRFRGFCVPLAFQNWRNSREDLSDLSRPDQLKCGATLVKQKESHKVRWLMCEFLNLIWFYMKRLKQWSMYSNKNHQYKSNKIWLSGYFPTVSLMVACAVTDHIWQEMFSPQKKKKILK